jgi:AcrR family transcriptional regulator
VTRADGDDRNRQTRGDARRQQILDAAVELFGSMGYRGTGVAALAERVGMTAPGMLYYFGSKERLLQEVVAERDRADSLPEGPPASLRDLRDLGRHNMRTAALTRLFVVLGAESLDPGDPLHHFFVERYETARTLVVTILDADIAAGRVRPEVDVNQVATEMIAMLMGLEIQWLADPKRVDLGVAVESYVDRLVAELAPKRS